MAVSAGAHRGVVAQCAIAAAEAAEGVVCTGPELTLPVVLAMADVVVSNGSSVAMEGIVIGRPALCVTSWQHPAGPTGDDLLVPSSDVAGIVVGPAEAIPEMLRKALHPSVWPYVEMGREQLVPVDSLGRASETAADEIEFMVAKVTEVERLRHRILALETRVREMENAPEPGDIKPC